MITASEFLKWLLIFGVHTGGGGGGTVTSITAGTGLTGGTITDSGTIALDIPVTSVHGGTGLTSFAANSLLYASGANTWAALASANNAVLSTNGSGVPSLSTTLPSGLTIPGYLPLSGGTMSGQLILNGAPLTDTAAATKLYVDQTVVSLTPTQPVQAASTANFAATYNNGTAGVGATLTATSTGTVTLDGILTVSGKDYLFKDQTDNTQNGSYTCTTAGAIGVAAVFTRADWFDTPAAINTAGLTPVVNGSTQAGTAWYETNDVTNIGSDPIVFVKFGSSGTVTSITAGTGLTGGTITGSGTIALAIPVTTPDGGTGIISPTAHNLLIGAGASAMTLLAPSATSGVPLISQGSSADPVYGTALVAGGGTGLVTTTAYGLIAGGTTATGNFQNVGTGASGTMLQGAGNAALPAWSTATYPSTTTINQLLYSSANNTITGLATANNAVLSTGGTGIPVLSTTLPSGLTIPGYAASGANGDITSMTGLTGALRAPTAILDSNGNNQFVFTTVTSAVNYINVLNSATGNYPILRGTGTDAAVGFNFQSKNGYFQFSDYTTTNPAAIVLFATAGTLGVGFAAPSSLAGNTVWTLPSADSAGLWQSNGSAVLSITNTPVLGTPASGTLTNCTGYTVANLADVAWTDFSGTIGYTGFSGTPTTTYARYKKIGKTLFFQIDMSGTSNSTAFTITGMPATSAIGTNTNSPVYQAVNNGTPNYTVQFSMSASSTTLVMTLSNNASGWTNTGTKGISFSGFYEIT
jgi:hypothetical protein